MARMKLVWAVATLAVALAAAATSSAADLAAPSWRGTAGSTFQQWDFTTDANPAAPELVSNPYGAPSAAIGLGDYAAGWLDQLPGMGSLTGYWDLGMSGTVSADIANDAVSAAYKEVWVQVTYFKDITDAPVVDVAGGVRVGDVQTLVVEEVPTGGSWFLDQSLWRIDPSPSSETVVVTSDATWGSVVDSVVVDTRNVVPEPATVTALLMGCVGMLIRRRRA